jgi:molecular chaperone DnaJ
MDRNDYYTLLGVKRTASRAEIRRAFQKLARKYHPDLNPGDNVAALRYQRLEEAYEVLSDPRERERYDEVGARPRSKAKPEPARYGFEGFDFSLKVERREDIFWDLFPRHRESEKGGERGEDIHHRLTIGFDESMAGVRTSFQLNRSVSCETCEGFGDIPASKPTTCTACGGRGRSTQTRGFMLFTKPCPGCHGQGSVARERCPTCAGAGRSPSRESVSVAIPAGVSDGDTLSIPGRGHEGRGRTGSGDLYVHVSVAPHPFFTRKGDNLYCAVPITFTEAALGARVEVPTPDGKVILRIPAGVQSGQKLRISERGAPSRRGDARGDLFVVAQVVTPRIYDDRSRELLRELAKASSESPREDLWDPENSQEEISP